MSNKSQILCNLNNSIKVDRLKLERKRIRWNREELNTQKAKLSKLEQNNNSNISIQDPYHPDNNIYIEKIKWIRELERSIELNSKWIRIFSESISESTS